MLIINTHNNISEFINSQAKNYLTMLNNFEDVLAEINPQLEYKFKISTDKPFLICSIKQLGLSKNFTFSDMKVIMDKENCNEKEAVVKLLESIIGGTNSHF